MSLSGILNDSLRPQNNLMEEFNEDEDPFFKEDPDQMPAPYDNMDNELNYD